MNDLNNQSIDILGTSYVILFKDFEEYPEFRDRGACGFCDSVLKEIIICNITSNPEFSNVSCTYSDRLTKEILRHEILHAFLYESGLGLDSVIVDCGWSQNEEMVDWFATQSPKIYRIYKKLEII